MIPIINRSTGMNKTETRYSEHLRILCIQREIESWKFEPMGLKLAVEKCFYYPDFFVVYKDHFEFHEVKAYDKKKDAPLVKDDALVKIKVAACEFPWMDFKITWFRSQLPLKKVTTVSDVFSGNRWEYRTIKGGK